MLFKVFWVLLIIAVVAYGVFLTVSLISNQIVVDQLSGDPRTQAIQTKITYNAIQFVALIVSGSSSLLLAIAAFSRYIMHWRWALRLP
jgi:membrane-bound acyltransferase YfiQ involved in biofilm formation